MNEPDNVMPARSPLNVNIFRKIRVRPKYSSDPPMTLFQRKAEELRKKVAARDPALVTKTRLKEPPIRITNEKITKVEWSLFDRVFGLSPLM